ncbi:phosphoribosyl-ATP diphosphatase [Pseudobythopirellula maris]|uniref:phosphoribosyl-ATP diphosphatase n=1 Tax=Pseudobythopirellula maris TaxID=2527991 RepID=UPI001E3BC57F|nr:phosphoribosyl-ATP diphosphatase [Pseudobythopirellula maris]
MNPPPAASRPLDLLEETIRQRAAALERADQAATKSYTAKLLQGGVPKIGPKVTEEAAELVEAAGEEGDAGREHFIYEAGDLLYHTLVLLRSRGVELAEVEAELGRRFGVSGLTEKANRSR